MGFVGFEAGLDGKTVTGAPFTASFSAQTTEMLTDGNKIQRSATGTIARDSQGRTRRDLTLPAIGPWAASGKTPPQVSFINDPVAGIATCWKLIKRLRDKCGRMGAIPEVASQKSAAPQNQVTTLVARDANDQRNLGAGTRTTRTIPAGEIGNQNPIVIVIESWYSPDLQTVIMTKRTDPRMGETDFQLTNIQRAEPAATLFQVPAGYTVEQGVMEGGLLQKRDRRSVGFAVCFCSEEFHTMHAILAGGLAPRCAPSLLFTPRMGSSKEL